jgi:hypothetical protein
VPGSARWAMAAEFSLPLASAGSLLFFSRLLFFSFLLLQGQLGDALQVVLGLDSRDGKIESMSTDWLCMSCCTPVRPTWFRSGAVGSGLRAASCEAEEQLGQLIGAWMWV